MKISVLANLYGAKPLDETLSILTGLGVHTVELGAGGYPGKAHCNPAELLADPTKYDEFIATLKKYDVDVCALATHGNAVHPDKAIAAEFLPMLYQKLVVERENPVELRLDETAQSIIPGTAAGPQDFDTEFLDYILAVKCVEDVNEAVDHISAHSTGHSEAIISTDPEAIGVFTTGVDSSAVYVNASTRFTDGGEFGLGCEMGISTQKLHARGPMGLRELTTYKYIIRGQGHIR